LVTTIFDRYDQPETLGSELARRVIVMLDAERQLAAQRRRVARERLFVLTRPS
jgi:hypothetical protein